MCNSRIYYKVEYCIQKLYVFIELYKKFTFRPPSVFAILTISGLLLMTQFFDVRFNRLRRGFIRICINDTTSTGTPGKSLRSLGVPWSPAVPRSPGFKPNSGALRSPRIQRSPRFPRSTRSPDGTYVILRITELFPI